MAVTPAVPVEAQAAEDKKKMEKKILGTSLPRHSSHLSCHPLFCRMLTSP
ncbi:hypothetical protein COLO4_06935 [Corchorus olitorius]|uniref:Uncharacterized protein n=1 Tax=Corchorus olitorius TaxID=93759 RepID=A0A1R3KLF8_9ROSI|nr:hypothetical protein COLO4_06935 [Corchorus olitorius]